MKKLSFKIPQFALKRYGQLKLDGEKVTMSGIDLSGAPYGIFKSVTCVKSKDAVESCLLGSVSVKATFQGNYNEPELEFKVPLSDFEDETCRVMMTFSPFSGKWESVAVQNASGTEVLNVLEHKNNRIGLAVPEKKEDVASLSGSSARSKSTAASGRVAAPAKRVPEKKTQPAKLAPEKKQAPNRGKSIGPSSKAPRPAPFSHHFNQKDIDKAEKVVADISKQFEKL